MTIIGDPRSFFTETLLALALASGSSLERARHFEQMDLLKIESALARDDVPSERSQERGIVRRSTMSKWRRIHLEMR